MDLDSAISQVTVFRSGAVVTRTAVLSAPVTDPELVFNGLPTVLDDASVRVRVVGADTLPTDVRVELVLPPIGASIEDAETEKLSAALQALSALHAEKDRVQQEIALFDSLTPELAPADGSERPKPAATAAWRETLAWQRKETERRQEELADLAKRIKAADEERARLERSIRVIRAERENRATGVSKRVVFGVTAALVAGTQVVLEYRVFGARWAPSYVVRVARDGKTCELSLRALVAQNTGERWPRVKLALSTAELLRAQDIPELKSLRIGRVLPTPARPAWRDPPGDTDRLFAALDGAMGRDPTPPALTTETMRPMSSRAVPPPPMTTVSNELSTRTGGGPGFAAMAFGGGLPGGPPMQPQPPQAMPPPPPPMSPPRPSAAAMPVNAPAPAMQMSKGAAPSPKMKKADRSASMTRAGMVMDDMLAMPSADEAPGEPAPDMEEAQQEAAVVFALKQLRYAELKVVGFRGADRGKLRPITDQDRVGGEDGALAARVMSFMAAAMQNAVRAEQNAFGVPVAQSAGVFDYRYDSDGVVDVPADGQVHNIALLKRKADMKSVYVAVPRESTDVVRIATMKNPLTAPLLAGDAEVYLDDEFLVGTALRTVPAGGEVTIGLGVEQAVKVARRVKYEEETEGFLRGSRGLDHAIEIEVASRLRVPIDVDVRERTPVTPPGEKDIEVEVKNVSPAWEPFDQQETNIIRGGHRWRFSLEPGAKKTLAFSYRVKIDSKAELVGGNRREPY